LDRVRRVALVLGVCLGVGAASLAAASGPRTDPGAAVVAAARTHLGEPYVWGGETSKEGWDCSGLVFATWGAYVKGLPRVSRQQQAWAVPIPVDQVLPGDLVFFGEPVFHVGIVTARTGETVRMIDSASSRKGVVERLAFPADVVRYGRVPRPGMPAVRPWAPVVRPVPAATPVPVLTLPAPQQAYPSSKLALAAATVARRAVGSADPGDAAFVGRVWRQAGGAALPATKEGLAAAGRVVPLADARVGDLVVYPSPRAHVGLYVGGGLMVDASRSQGKVVLRPVWRDTGLRLVRLG
jgi:cell wall-associated NlpC family hydrolase